MIKEFKCIYCSELEVNKHSNKQENKETIYHCRNCNSTYNQKTLLNYYSLTAVEKVIFRYKHWLLNKDN